ncbi:MAG: 1-deoxy-D-xylulose-5-phosphate synthase [Bacilli bacterium]
MIKLEEIRNPEFLKDLSIKELEDLAKQIRKFIIDNISKTGGHLSSNLGIIELTIALHYVFNSPHDKLIFDVGHQTYTHKILTGRAKEFKNLRKYKGMSGFLKTKESVHDVWEAGHSSTSISAAAGFLEAKSAGANIGEVVAIIGDGSIQNGLAFSAMNYLGSRTDQKSIIILNDNNMSISPNVGVLGKAFDKIRLQKSYSLLRRITPKFIKKLFSKEKSALSAYLHGNNLMASFGFRYFGPTNGHKIKELIKFLEHAKKSNSSIIIHVKTLKGKGFKYAEEDQQGIWHGVGPFNPETGEIKAKETNGFVSWSNGIGNLILEKAKHNSKIKVITPAMVQGSGLAKFADELPKQLIDVGIAEEHSVVMASAMSINGLIPVVSIYSTFMQRAYDQINHDVARINSHVIFLVDRSGIVGEDGDTHQGTFDIAFLSSIPNMVITMPKDLDEANSLLDYGLNDHNGPFVIRYPRGNTNKVNITNKKLELGKWDKIIDNNNNYLITYGPAVGDAKKIIKNDNLNIGLINARFIKPLDLVLLRSLENKNIIVYEEVTKYGSLASLIYQANNEFNLNLKITSCAIDDIFVEQGKTELVKKDLGLDILDILKNVK